MSESKKLSAYTESITITPALPTTMAKPLPRGSLVSGLPSFILLRNTMGKIIASAIAT